MGTEFLRLRRKNALWRILRALLTGVAAGLLLAGCLMVMFKLTTTDGQMVLCLAAGAGAALVVAVIRWLLLRRSDLRAAEQIDAEHRLNERVQTMIAFRDGDSAMLQLQRQDTEERLRKVRRYDVRFANVSSHILAVVLAAAVLAGGVILPARAEPTPPVYVEPEFNASAWQKSSLDALIVHVQESNMAEPAKASTVAELQGLRDSLEASATVSVFKNRVITVITNVYTYTDRTNSNDDMHDVLQMVEHDISELMCYTIGSLDNKQLNTDLEDIGFQLSQDYALPTLGQLAQGMDTQLARIPAEYVIKNDYTEEDRLYCAMVAFAADLHEVAQMVEDTDLSVPANVEAVATRISEVVYDLKGEVNLALEQQTMTKKECVYVVETLCTIFSLSAGECPADPDPVYSKKGDVDEEFEDVGGGVGTGEMQYAGDEQVFDYKQNKHVSYTEVIAEYYGEMAKANQEGTLSPEMVEFILKYFSQLYTG